MRDFLKYVFASFVGLLLFSTLSVGALFVLLVFIAVGSRDADPLVEENSILVFDLSLDITDADPATNPTDFLNDAFSGGGPVPISLRTVLDTLDEAATDDRISGILLQGAIATDGQGSGYATLTEVRRALSEFQAESGKPILAYDTSWSERDYYITSVADPIILNPTGAIELDGFSSETTFLGDAFDQYGIDVQIIRAGQYKSAVEPFTRNSNSPENREQLQQLLDDLWTEFLETTSADRNLQPTDLEAIANRRGILLAPEAQSEGIVDQVWFADEVIAELRTVTGQSDDSISNSEPAFRNISLPAYANAVGTMQRDEFSRNRIAVVYADGAIVSGEGGPGVIGGDSLSRQLRELRQDDDIKAIVLRVNSPGGGASPSEIIAREVMLTRDEKPVIVSMGSVAASGGYMIAAYGDRIFASPTTITGSIGVFGLVLNVQDLANENGITWDVVKTAPFADSGTLARPLTEQELAINQGVVDQVYDRFLDVVTEGRPLTAQEASAVAQGRVWSGTDAQQVGLVDEMGGLNDAIAAAVEAADLGDDWQLQEYPRPRTLEQQILESLFGSQLRSRLTRTPTDPITEELQQFQVQLRQFQALNDPRGTYVVLPFFPRID
jgi:protease IV